MRRTNAPLRVIAAVGALGAALLNLAGCETLLLRGEGQVNGVNGSLLLLSELTGGSHMVAASLETTTRSLENSLRRLGLEAVVTNEGGRVRIASQTPDGARFSLVLTPAGVPGSPAKFTQVALEWHDRADSQRSFQILTQLERQGRPDAPGAQK
jgi:hypothetical protein